MAVARLKDTKRKEREFLKDMTISETSVAGVVGTDGSLSFLCKDMTFTQCRCSGVYAWNTKGRFINCVWLV